jgi:hypothetical protein
MVVLIIPQTLINHCSNNHVVQAWEWSDFVGNNNMNKGTPLPNLVTTLSIQEVSDMRVRDIKRRLSRSHGYSAEELTKILDKKELIQILAFEEEKVRVQQESVAKRIIVQQGIIASIIVIVIFLCWPLFTHAYNVAAVNLVVYTDRKRIEAQKCHELRSYRGLIGVLLMGLLDILQIWLTASVILSWITTSKYFFPIPRLTIRPAQLMGGDIANSSIANYGINVGSMLVTYGLRYSYGKIESWTGVVLSNKARQQRQETRKFESVDERTARKAARKAMKVETLYRQQQQQAAMTSSMNQKPIPPPPPEWVAATQLSARMDDVSTKLTNGQSHQTFLHELDKYLVSRDDDQSDDIVIVDNDDNNATSMTLEELD